MTYNHLLHLLLHAHPRDDLHVLHAAEDFVLDAEASLHAESGALLDGEGLLVEGLEGAGLGQVDDDVRSALDFQTQGEQDDLARVVGVGDGLAAAETERLFPLAEGFIVLVCGEGDVSEEWRGRVWYDGWRGFFEMLTATMLFSYRASACGRFRYVVSFGDLPSFWYSSIVFFSPTLKPSVCSGTRSSLTAASLDMMAVGTEDGIGCVQV